MEILAKKTVRRQNQLSGRVARGCQADRHGDSRSGTQLGAEPPKCLGDAVDEPRTAGTSGNRRETPVGISPRVDAESVLLECYENGVRVRLDVAAARKKWRTVDFAWALPTDVYRWAWGGHSGSGQVLATAPESGRKFGYCLLTQTAPLTSWDMVEYDPTFDDALFNSFVARASRFNRLFPERVRRQDPLFKYCRILKPHMKAEPAYQVVPGRTTLLIVGLDAAGGPPSVPVDWRAFETTPGAPTAGECEKSGTL